MSARPEKTIAPRARIGMVSLGCPKALVDSERILTKLRSQGYEIGVDYEDADAVIVNTCGFLDSAKAESLQTIGEALKENGKVIVTGCMGGDADLIRKQYPDILSISGPQDYQSVVKAVHEVLPPVHEPFLDLVPPQGIKLTPRHYAYIKISEGCDHKCSFCIIPQLRGPLSSRPEKHILHEALKLTDNGCQELLVISQDTSAYGLDKSLKAERQKLSEYPITKLVRALGELDVWVRLHYVYPYPHVDELIELMAQGLILPYLDIPFQHASPAVLKQMRRPAAHDRLLERLAEWRQKVPDLVLRSTMIVGFPGETDEDFEHLLKWLDEARLDRVGCFTYEDVKGARSNILDGHLPQTIKNQRWHELMAKQSSISRAKLADRVGREYEMIIDGHHEDGIAIARSYAEAPDIDGVIYVADPDNEFLPGDRFEAEITASGDHDLFVGLDPGSIQY